MPFDLSPRSFLLTLLMALLASAGSLLAATPDVRILIDVSGSMRQNDPQNLRVPALRLVNELLPEGAEAGVWLFAEKTEILAPPGKVDKKWKTQTRARLERIHSRGLFTDIEHAISAAIADWDESPGTTDRHLVLLTDGLVDVAKDPEKSAESRERMISEQIAQLKASDIKTHVVALSDKVDTELMRLLTKETGGWLEFAKDADALQRVFLHMLEQTATPTTVPLKGNRFEIDAQVSEFTLLAFRSKEGSTSLVSPDGKTISAKQQAVGAAWREEEGYDLVTLGKPKPGQWQLQGAADPDNRVVVVTDLGIELGPLPNTLGQGEILGIEAWLTDHRQPVTRSDLLPLVTAQANLTPIQPTPHQEAAGEHAPPLDAEHQAPRPEIPESSQPTELSLHLDQESGRFRADLETKSLSPGVYQLQVTLDGGTFKRQAVKQFKIIGSPLTIRYAQQNPSDETPSAALIATLDAELDLIDPSSLSGYLIMSGSDDRNAVIDVPKPAALPCVLTIPVEMPGEYQMSGRLMAQTLNGKMIDVEPEPKHFIFEFTAPVPLADDIAKHESPWQSLSWLELIVYLFVGNTILGLMLGLTWWLLHRSRKNIAAVTPKRPTGTKA